MKYYLVGKRKEALMHATAWMKLENIMQSERSQTLLHSYETFRIDKPVATESRLGVARGWGRGMKRDHHGKGISFGG